MSTPRSGRRIALWIALTVLGVAANYFRVPLIMSLEFLFGSVFSIVLLRFFGLNPALLSAIITSSVTYFLWNHPYFIITSVSEVLFLGLLSRRSNNIILNDCIFWIFIGLPQIVFIYCFTMGLEYNIVKLIFLKQSTNGIFNATVASIIIMAYVLAPAKLSKRTYSENVSFSNLLFNCLILFIMAPTLTMLFARSHYEQLKIEREAKNHVFHVAAHFSDMVNSWINHHLQVVLTIAEHIGDPDDPEITRKQPLLAFAKQSASSDFLRMAVRNSDGVTMISAPTHDRSGAPLAGQSFSDRPYFQEMSKSLKPLISEVFTGRIGPSVPIVAVAAPIVSNERFKGCAVGAVDLNALTSLIESAMKQWSMSATILDKTGRVITSSRKDLKPMDSFDIGAGQALRDLGDGIYSLMPKTKANISNSDLWSKMKYVSKVHLADLSGWTCVVEMPLSLYYSNLVGEYMSVMLLLLIMSVSAVLVSAFLSKALASPLAELQVLTHDAPGRIFNNMTVSVGKSYIAEVDALGRNFQEMMSALSQQVHQLKALNAELDDRVRERTKEILDTKLFYENILESIHEGVWVTDENDLIVYANKGLCMIGGSDRSEIVGKHILSGFSEETIHSFRLHYLSAKEKLEPVFYDSIPIYTPGGRMSYQTGWIIPIVRRNKPVMVLGTTDDVTERRAFEEKLRMLTAEQATILENASIGIAYVKERKISWVNERLGETLGMSKDEMAGQSTEIIYPSREDFIEAGEESGPVVLGGLVCRMERRLKRKDGSLFWCKMTGKAIDPSDPAQGSIWLLEDISHHRDMQERIKEERQRFFSLLEELPVFIYLQASDYTIRYANKLFKRLFGEPHGRPCYEVVAKRTAPCENCPTFTVFDSKTPLMWEWNRPSEDKVYQIYDYPFLDVDGSQLVLELGVDVTDQKKYEARLKSTAEDLEAMVRQEIARSRQREQLLIHQSKLAAMGEMIGAIAHQWRQPLAAVAAIIQDVEDAFDHGQLGKDYLEDAVAQSMAQLDFMSKTIDDFRNFFAPSKEKVRFDAIKAVIEVLSMASSQIENNYIALRYSCRSLDRSFNSAHEVEPCRKFVVHGYPNEFKHAILNILYNARDAILGRREKGNLGNAEGFIDIHISCERGIIIIQIADNGGGIDSDIINRIFEPYFTTKEQGKGTGIGLYMSKVIVEDNMNGRISVTNMENGAEFTIELRGEVENAIR